VSVRKETIGDCELYLGDCRDVLPTLADASVEMIFTDPPYGHNNNNGDLIHRREAALNRGKPATARPIVNDGAEANGLVEFLFCEASRLLVRYGVCCCCCGGGGGPDPQFARWSLMMDAHLAFNQMVVWDKGPIGMGWRYRRSYETVLVGHRKNGTLSWYDETNRIENIIRQGAYGINKIIPSDREHPTPKPAALCAHFIRLHTQSGELVLDPFMGAAPVAEACIKLGRRFVGIELDRHWFDMACHRIEAIYRQGDMFRAPARQQPVQERLMFGPAA